MKINSFALTDIGLKRKNNQDSFLKDDDLRLYIVADGMGGHRGGEVASRLAVEVTRIYCRDNPDVGGGEALDRGINLSCQQIYKEALENEDLMGMGTTVAALYFKDDTVFVGQVGDSRAYLIHEDSIWQITEDHSLLNEEIRAGRLSADQAASYQFRNVITRSVGYESQVQVDVYRRKAKAHDIFFLCTDGLSGLVESAEILQEIRTHGPEQGLKNLIALANARGGDDNITALACQVLSVGG